MRRPSGVLGQSSRKPHIINGAAPRVAINIQTPVLVLCRNATKTAANAKQAVTPTSTPPLGIIKSSAKITNAAMNNKIASTSSDKAKVLPFKNLILKPRLELYIGEQQAEIYPSRFS